MSDDKRQIAADIREMTKLMRGTNHVSDLEIATLDEIAVKVESLPQLEPPKRYNGWTNYETWNVALWIDNEPGTYHEAREKTQEAYDATDEDDSHEDRLEEAARELSNTIEEWVTEEMLPDLGASFASDLLNAAVSEINWYEIAENWLSDIEAPEKDEPEAVNE